MEQLYEFLSEMTHTVRGRVAEIPAVGPRFMPIGPHPDSRVRGAFVYYTGIHVVETVSAVGFGLGTILGVGIVHRTQATVRALQELDTKAPLDPASLSGSAKTEGQEPESP